MKTISHLICPSIQRRELRELSGRVGEQVEGTYRYGQPPVVEFLEQLESADLRIQEAIFGITKVVLREAKGESGQSGYGR